MPSFPLFPMVGSKSHIGTVALSERLFPKANGWKCKLLLGHGTKHVDAPKTGE